MLILIRLCTASETICTFLHQKIKMFLLRWWNYGAEEMNHMQPVETICRLVVLSSACWNHLPTAGTLCHLLKPSAACWNHLPPGITICRQVEPSAASWNYLPSAETICHLLEPSTTWWNHLLSDEPSAACWNHLLPAGTICHLLEPSVDCWNRLSPAENICRLLEPLATCWNHALLVVWSGPPPTAQPRQPCSSSGRHRYHVLDVHWYLIFCTLRHWWYLNFILFLFGISQLQIPFSMDLHTFFTLVRVTHFCTNSSVLHFRELPVGTSEYFILVL